MVQPPLKIAVISANATGLSSAVVLARQHDVVIQDDDANRIDHINSGRSPLEDPDIRQYLARPALRLKATGHDPEALRQASLVIVATSTTFQAGKNKIGTQALDEQIQRVQRLNPDALTVIESTLPVGYTRSRCAQLGLKNLIAAPALVRPGQALQDRLHPTRFIVGEQSARGRFYASLLQSCSLLPHVPLLLTGSAEAEAIQLLSLRRMLVNEALPDELLDRYATRHLLNIRHLREGLDAPCVDTCANR